jgi:diacylglycerol kinase family enzyme
MTTIKTVSIIYNPNSTGDGKTNAIQLSEKLKKKGMRVTLIETEYAKHAEKLAKGIADKHPSAMIISSSGDGGYHEVVNGVLASKHPGVVTGVLPSGNANDHYHFAHHGNTVKRILEGSVDEIDVLSVKTSRGIRYAHSYVGLGVTPQIGEVLTQHSLNPFNEVWLVIKHLFVIRPIKISRNSKVTRYDHMVFSSSGRMSKVLTLSTAAKIDDGKMEVTTKREGSLIALLAHFIQTVLSPSSDTPTYEQYEFTVLKATTMQLDGEVYEVKAGERILIKCEKQLLRCIV